MIVYNKNVYKKYFSVIYNNELNTLHLNLVIILNILNFLLLNF